ncbi:MAG: PA0069 family radical SAM protein [Parvularculaceae bacterium]|nr:PA0069 family radical SAM protein [Parvularculaceae bacterium]
MTRAADPSPASRSPTEARPPAPAKGRGARSNVSGRYERLSREDIDDGWETAPESAGKTELTLETPRTIINYVSSPYVGFDRSINPYRGCEHGCVYCFARPTHAYYGLSAGLDFETKIFAKPNAPALLERELGARNYKPRHIAIGTNTDPYQPVERKQRLMRGILSALAKFNHPVSVLTKSSLIERDIDLLAPMAQARIVRTMLSVTTLDAKLARAMEPRASTPTRRLGSIKALKAAGVPVGVMTAPIIPGLNDHEIEDLLDAARNAGADWAGYTIIRLPLEIAHLFREWLVAERPDRAARVMRQIREMNGGRDYDIEYSRAKSPRSVVAKLIAQRFEKAAQRLGFPAEPPKFDLNLFRRPDGAAAQLTLF